MRSSIASWPTMTRRTSKRIASVDRPRVVRVGQGAQVARRLRRNGLGHGGTSHVAVGWVGWLSISRENPLSQPFLKTR